jgi:hypothetical protein
MDYLVTAHNCSGFGILGVHTPEGFRPDAISKPNFPHGARFPIWEWERPCCKGYC